MGRQYTRIQHDLLEIMKMKTEGYTHREIGEKLGYTKNQVKKLVERAREKSRKEPQLMQPEEEQLITEVNLELEIKRLKMENELLRNFLQSIGRG